MADAIVSLVAEKLLVVISEEASFLYGIRGQVARMERELRRMNAFLKNAEERETSDSQVMERVKDVRDIAYDAEDIVETYIFQMNQRRRQTRHNFIGLVKRYGSLPCEIIARHNIGKQIRNVKSRLKEISDRTFPYDRPPNADPEPRNVDDKAKERRKIALHRDINVVIGFQADIEKIVKLLLDNHDGRSVISIVGMGGSGKTTLARRVCDHDLVRSYFGLYRASASVSQTYNDIKIIRDIAKDILDKERVKHMDERELKDELFDALKTQRYLILLDDIWQPEDWTNIQSHFPDVKNGSRLIITTRSGEVAKFVSPSIPPHKMRSFTEDESWELFCKIAFPHEDASTICTGELERLSKTAIQKCEGLPLAVAVMAGFVSTRPRTPTAWREALQRIDWDRIPNGQVCMQILSLSFKSLPPYLKPCFMYLGCFPEDYIMEADDIISLWVAEGLVSPQEEDGGNQG